MQVFVAAAVYPNDDGHQYQCHRRQNHQAVVYIPVIVAPLRHHLHAEERAATEQFAEETYHGQYHGITDAVAHAVKERRPRPVSHSEGLEASHKYAIGNYKPDKNRKLATDIVVVSQKKLVDYNHQRCHHHQLDYDADICRYCIAYQ